MRPALALIATLLLASAAGADALETSPSVAHRALRVGPGAAGVGRCTSDGACTFTRDDGKSVRGAGVVSGPGRAKSGARVKARHPVTPTA